jgi:hypothetical protein
MKTISIGIDADNMPVQTPTLIRPAINIAIVVIQSTSVAI